MFRLIKKFIKMPIKPRNTNPTINSIVLYCSAILVLSNLEKNKKNFPNPKTDIKVNNVNTSNEINEIIKTIN